MLFTDNDITLDIDKDGKVKPVITQVSTSEMTGCDWGNHNDDLCPKGNAGGLFYNIGCSTIETSIKSCFNLSRICELGVSLDESKHIPNLESLENGDESAYDTLVPDGYISKDELYGVDERSMFATLNVNGLRTVLDERGMRVYDFRYLYLDNFDGSLKSDMKSTQRSCDKTSKKNYLLENFSRGYYDFRMGRKPVYYPSYDSDDSSYDTAFPRYENSLYFYFGLKHGKTAIDKFNSQFFADCSDSDTAVSPIGVISQPNSWCSEMEENGDGYMAFNLSKIDKPCDVYITSMSDMSNQIILKNIDDDKIFISPDLNELDGYVKYEDVEVIPADKTFGEVFLNGNYEISVVDSNGDTSVTTIDMRPEYVSFKVNEFDFEYSEADLSSIYFNNKTGDELYKAIGQRSITDKTEIGGYIEIHNVDIKCNGKIVENFMLTLTGNIKIKTGERKSVSCQYANGRFSHSDYISGVKIGQDDDFVIRFYLPKGDEIYKVEVTECCDKTCVQVTNNKTEKSVKVSYPEPFKLYINDIIDYDVISDWNAGWKMEDSIIGDNNDVADDRSHFSDNWLHMSDITRYNWPKMVSYGKTVEEIDELFVEYEINATVENCLVGNKKIYGSKIFDGDWTGWNDLSLKLTACGYSDSAKAIVKKFYDNLSPTEEQKEACDACLSLLNEIIESELEFMDMMRLTFQQTCENSSNVFNFSATGSKRPFTFHMFSREEEETSELYNNTLAFEGMTYNNDGISIDGDIMPTITSKKDERYGTDESEYEINGDLCFAMDKNSSMRNKHKYPYFIAVSDMHEPAATIPNGLIIDNGSTPPEIDENVDLVFGFHVINKVFKFRNNLFGKINSTPVFMPFGLWGCRKDQTEWDSSGKIVRNYKSKNDVKCKYSNVYNGAFVSIEGMMAGELRNGRATSYYGGGSHLTNFVRQTNGSEKLLFYTKRGQNETDEQVDDKIPTERYLISSAENPAWIDYDNGLGNLVSGNYIQYSPLRSDKPTSLNITDENNCTISRQIISNFSVVLDGSSMNDRSDSTRMKFNVSVSGGTGKVMYYVFPYIDHKQQDSLANPNVSGNGLERYPLNHAMENNGKWQYDMIPDNENNFNEVNFSWGDPAYSLFSYKTYNTYFSDTGRDEIAEFIGVVWQDMTGDVMSTVGGRDTYGYSDTGEFEVEGDMDNAFFVVAVTSEGMKAISPVYDYIDMEGYASLVNLSTKKFVSSRDEGGSTIVEYKAESNVAIGFGVFYHFENAEAAERGDEVKMVDDFYYVNYYPHTLSIRVDLGIVEKETETGETVRQSLGVIYGSKDVLGYVDSGVKDLLEAVVVIPSDKVEIIRQYDIDILDKLEDAEITLTDITGLTHRKEGDIYVNESVNLPSNENEPTEMSSNSLRKIRQQETKRSASFRDSSKIMVTWSLNDNSARWTKENIPQEYSRLYIKKGDDEPDYFLNDYKMGESANDVVPPPGKVLLGWSNNKNAATSIGFTAENGDYGTWKFISVENEGCGLNGPETWYAIWGDLGEQVTKVK